MGSLLVREGSQNVTLVLGLHSTTAAAVLTAGRATDPATSVARGGSRMPDPKLRMIVDWPLEILSDGAAVEPRIGTFR